MLKQTAQENQMMICYQFQFMIQQKVNVTTDFYHWICNQLFLQAGFME